MESKYPGKALLEVPTCVGPFPVYLQAQERKCHWKFVKAAFPLLSKLFSDRNQMHTQPLIPRGIFPANPPSQ